MIVRVITAVAAVISIGFASAQAADMPVKAPRLTAFPVTQWDGWYVGVQAGGGWVRDTLTEPVSPLVPPMTGSARLHENGILGGVYVGYNWQRGNFVFGPEADFEGTSLNKTSNCLIQDPGVGNGAPGTCFANTAALSYSFRTQLPWQASFRGRLGYASGNILYYVTGGVAVADIKTNYAQFGTFGVPGSQTFNKDKAGGTIGAGVEYRFLGNWIGRAEYRYTDFGSVSNAITSGGFPFWNGFVDRHAVTENAVRLGISYLIK